MAKHKLPDKLSGVKFTTPKFRLSFPHLFEPTKYDKNSKPAYSIVMLFPKDQDLSSMKKSILSAAKEAFGADRKKWPKGLSLPWRDGDDKEDLAGYEGHFYAGAKSYNKPVVVDRDKNKIEIEDDIYGGCYARAVLVAKATEAGGKFYITLYLQAVQFIADGERFGGGVNLDEDFDDLEDDDTDGEFEEEEIEEDEDDDMGF